MMDSGPADAPEFYLTFVLCLTPGHKRDRGLDVGHHSYLFARQHAQHTTAQSAAWRGSFDQVEREEQRRENLSETDVKIAQRSRKLSELCFKCKVHYSLSAHVQSELGR
jgi:hypothetical protein